MRVIPHWKQTPVRVISITMNIEEYRDFCLSLGDDVEEKMPFGAFNQASGVLVFYVKGHMFSFFDTDNFGVVTLKCRPEEIEELKEQHPGIGNPYNLSAKHWIGVDAQRVDAQLMRELTRKSYEIVKTKYSKKK